MLVAARLGAGLVHDNPDTGTRQWWRGGKIINEHTRSECRLEYPFGIYDPPQFYD